jgi:glucose/arabinose dehydrogenase
METLHHRRLIFISGLVVLFNLLLGLPLLVRSQAGINLPTGFSSFFVTVGFSNPTGMAFAPDGRLFILDQSGTVRILSGGALLPTPFATFNVDSKGERGLLGIAFDPSFSTNNYIYFYYTEPDTGSSNPMHNRVVRVTANGNVMQAGSEILIYQLDTLTWSQQYHNGGAISFSPTDGRNLYIATGENYTQSNAQSLTSTLGKILRITVNTNGTVTIPTDNPFYDGPGGNNDAIWAYGLRNPFVIAFQPGTGRLFINDVGEWVWEEINDGIAGANYGWPTTEGPTTNPDFRNSLCAYPHPASSGLIGNSSCGLTPQTTPALGCAITAGVFYNPSTQMFPGDFVGDYLFVDYCNNWIKRYDIATDKVLDFASNIPAYILDMDLASDGSIYYISHGDTGIPSALYRLTYNGGNNPPTITQHPSDRTVAEGETAQFSCAASGTAPLSYQWQRKNSGAGSFSNISGATSTSYTTPATVVATDDQAQFQCVATNPYGNAISNAATLTVQQNQRPTANITTPISGTLFTGGQVISFSGTGTDPEDGTLPDSAFTWEVQLHHTPPGQAEHTHPAMLPVSGFTSGTFTISTDHGNNDHFFRIILTVTDSQGLSYQVTRDIYPKVVDVSIRTQPSGLQVTLDGQPKTTPINGEWVVNVPRSIGDLSPQVVNGQTYIFQSWSDGGSHLHTVITPNTNTIYTAIYSPGIAMPNYYTIANPSLTWSPVPWARAYHIQVDNNSDFSSPEYENSTISPGATSIAPTLGDGVWYWRLRALRENQTWGPWSGVGSFTIDLP